MTFLIAALIVLGLLATWLRRRRARRVELAGLTAVKPVFSVEPPSRRHHKLGGEAL